MLEIPLTSFIDFVLKSGSPKMTCAKKIKSQLNENYDPAHDYYRRFREAVQGFHKSGAEKSKLVEMIGGLPDPKQENYHAMIQGYKKFLGRRDITCFEPPRFKWKHSDLVIPVNPELCLSWDGSKYVIKLYLKAEKPSKDRLSSILALMHETLPDEGWQFGLLDVRNSKLYLYEKSMLELMPVVEGEVDSLALILDRI